MGGYVMDVGDILLPSMAVIIVIVTLLLLASTVLALWRRRWWRRGHHHPLGSLFLFSQCAGRKGEHGAPRVVKSAATGGFRRRLVARSFALLVCVAILTSNLVLLARVRRSERRAVELEATLTLQRRRAMNLEQTLMSLPPAPPCASASHTRCPSRCPKCPSCQVVLGSHAMVTGCRGRDGESAQLRLENEYYNYLLDDLEEMHRSSRSRTKKKSIKCGTNEEDDDDEDVDDAQHVAADPRLQQQQQSTNSSSASSAAQKNSSTTTGEVPKNLIFNFKDKASIFTSDAARTQLLRQNVARVTALNPGWRVFFDDDAGCREKTMATGIFRDVGRRRIEQWYARAPGRLRSDLCRLAQLHVYKGGVYMDNDLELLEPLDSIFGPPDGAGGDDRRDDPDDAVYKKTSFASVWSAPAPVYPDFGNRDPDEDRVMFQAFMAASEDSRMITRGLELFRDHISGERLVRHHDLGTAVMARALKDVLLAEAAAAAGAGGGKGKKRGVRVGGGGGTRAEAEETAGGGAKQSGDVPVPPAPGEKPPDTPPPPPRPPPPSSADAADAAAAAVGIRMFREIPLTSQERVRMRRRRSGSCDMAVKMLRPHRGKGGAKKKGGGEEEEEEEEDVASIVAFSRAVTIGDASVSCRKGPGEEEQPDEDDGARRGAHAHAAAAAGDTIEVVDSGRRRGHRGRRTPSDPGDVIKTQEER